MRILVLEDDITLLGIWSEVLRSEGHEVTACSSLEDAKSILPFRRFDLFITDLCLNGDISLPVLQIASFRNPMAKIIVITGTGWFGCGEMAQIAPHVDLTLRKPLSNKDLLAYIDHLNGAARAPAATNIHYLFESA